MSTGVMSGQQESINFLVQERFQLYWRKIKLDHCLILRSLALWSVYYDTRQREHDFKPSDIGGSMGLLIGASVIALLEAMDAFATTLAGRWRQKKKLQRPSTRETESEM
ncbi:hypothetical protein NP493_434g02041 [Ridgeia piscesae]|uniref:Uncharacterized protein n=1 Tax=Ridgeia piscesae TaxID=27915 RepID=A0AAD9L0R2_RIDPI|nr:hypothetical protein NP493_434g02041 [Ridgeia piscesae]